MSDRYTGLPYPDDVLQKEIDIGLKTVQGNVEMMKRLLQQRTAKDQDEILNFLTRNEILVRKGFGREPYTVPQVTVTLAGETEEQYMGDEMDMATRELLVTAKLAADIAIDDPVPFTLQYNTLVNGPFPAAGGLIQINDEMMVYDVATVSTLHITGRKVRGSPKELHAIGDDISMKQIERYLGVHSLSTYRLDVLGDNADLVLWLQSLVKAVLLLKRARFSELGMDSIKISSTDFAPRPTIYPEFVYMRTIMVQSRIEVAFPEALAVLLNIELNPTIEGVIMSPANIGLEI